MCNVIPTFLLLIETGIIFSNFIILYVLIWHFQGGTPKYAYSLHIQKRVSAEINLAFYVIAAKLTVTES